MDGSRPERARFIPFRKRDIVAMCLARHAGGADAEAGEAIFRDRRIDDA
ncbi:MAG: hypothetical protein HC850_12885, partial [Rhodomicrobium sp.]|nr:hypothetical protein [Rhodomicrobium sp.]